MLRFLRRQAALRACQPMTNRPLREIGVRKTLWIKGFKAELDRYDILITNVANSRNLRALSLHSLPVNSISEPTTRPNRKLQEYFNFSQQLIILPRKATIGVKAAISC